MSFDFQNYLKFSNVNGKAKPSQEAQFSNN